MKQLPMGLASLCSSLRRQPVEISLSLALADGRRLVLSAKADQALASLDDDTVWKALVKASRKGKVRMRIRQ